MSQPGNTPYLTGHEALDVARMTGLPVYCRPGPRKERETPVHWSAAEAALTRGAWRPDDIVIDLNWLTYDERMRVAWCRIAGYSYLDNRT